MSDGRRLMDFFFITNGESATHYHQDFEIIYLISGSMDIQIDDDNYRLTDDDFVLINANKRHKVRAGGEVLGVRFVIDYHMLAEYMETTQLFFWCNTVADKNDAYDELRNLMNRIMERHFERNEKGSLYLHSLYYEFLYLLTSNFMIKVDDARMKVADSQDRKRIMQIQNYIQSNYQNQISLNDLAEQMYLSNAYLSKYIKKYMGMNFMDYLNNIRFFHAIDELLYSNKNLTRIALDNGFPSSSAFSKIFRSIHHEAPNEYRKRMKEERQQQYETDDLVSEQMIRVFLDRRPKQESNGVNESEPIVIDCQNSEPAMFCPCLAVNVGETAALLDSEVQSQLLELKKEAGIGIVRFWNILDFNITVTDSGIYNFRQLDRVLDFLVDHDIRPYLELGKKPRYIFNSPAEVLYEDVKENGFYTIGEFEDLITAWSIHLKERYGLAQLETWHFEFWNNPRLCMDREDGSWYDYFGCIWRAFRRLSPDIPCGGAGFVLGVDNDKNRKILQIWQQKEYQPDFISVYAYQYITIYQDGTPYGRKSVDSSYIRNQLAIFRQMLAAEWKSAPKVHLTEWNFTISNRNILNDSCGQGSYILKNSIELNDLLDMYIYWHGLDSYSEYKDSAKILVGDSGLISKDGLRKPGFYAYSFLHKMGLKIIGRCENSLITADGKNGFVIACHNFKKLSWKYVMADECMIRPQNLSSYFDDTQEIEQRLKLCHVKNGNYLIKVTYINAEHGSILDFWRQMGCRNVLGTREIEYLKQLCRPAKEVQMITVNDRTLFLNYTLSSQEIRLIEAIYI